MRSLFVGVALLLPGLAWAQQPTSYDLHLTPDQTALVLRGMQKLPYDEVAAAVQDVSRQITAQQKAAVEPKPEAPK